MAELCLSRIRWLGPAHARTLIEWFGGPREVLDADRRSLFRVPGMNQRLADSIQRAPAIDDLQEEAQRLRNAGIGTCLIGGSDYPSRLSLCPDAPVLLYGKGELDLERERMISIVGTRNITPYGKALCRELVEGLVSLDPVIVSGLAFGVDIKAHRTALKEGLSTIAVAGHGPDRVYPIEHAPDLQEMCYRGGLVTEFPLGTPPDRHHFPRRNRIIAGLTDCTVVVETGRKGGAMITADIAHSYEREVLTFPGPVNENSSSGCNRLIKEHKGALIEGVEDLLHQMHWEGVPKQREDGEAHQRELFLQDLEEEERGIARIVGEAGRISLDGIAVKADMPIGKLSPILLDLELKGVLNSLPGKIYVRADL
ncbi:MAG: DNA-processing protein DprA [Flavobacteriales bacterium]